MGVPERDAEAGVPPRGGIKEAKRGPCRTATQHQEAINKLNGAIQATATAAEKEAELREELGGYRLLLALAVFVVTGPSFQPAIYSLLQRCVG